MDRVVIVVVVVSAAEVVFVVGLRLDVSHELGNADETRLNSPRGPSY